MDIQIGLEANHFVNECVEADRIAYFVDCELSFVFFSILFIPSEHKKKVPIPNQLADLFSTYALPAKNKDFKKIAHVNSFRAREKEEQQPNSNTQSLLT